MKKSKTLLSLTAAFIIMLSGCAGENTGESDSNAPNNVETTQSMKDTSSIPSGTWQKINEPLPGDLGLILGSLKVDQFFIFGGDNVKYVYRWANESDPTDDMITWQFYDLNELDDNFYALTGEGNVFVYVIYSPEEELLYCYDATEIKFENPTADDLLGSENCKKFRYAAIGDAYYDLINKSVSVDEAIYNANFGLFN